MHFSRLTLGVRIVFVLLEGGWYFHSVLGKFTGWPNRFVTIFWRLWFGSCTMLPTCHVNTARLVGTWELPNQNAVANLMNHPVHFVCDFYCFSGASLFLNGLARMPAGENALDWHLAVCRLWSIACWVWPLPWGFSRWVAKFRSRWQNLYNMNRILWHFWAMTCRCYNRLITKSDHFKVAFMHGCVLNHHMSDLSWLSK